MGSAHRACNDFHHAREATRRAHLGPGLTRREVIGRGMLGGVALYAAQAMPWDRVLETAAAEAATSPNAPVLVSVFLPGGCDLLDALPPLSQFGAYADLRKTTMPAHPGRLGSTGLGHHPALGKGVGGGVAGMFARGRIGLLPGIDYANPDMSHFHSRHFWETGLVTDKPAPGWMGRWLDRHGSSANPLQGLTAGFELSPVLRPRSAPVAAVGSPGDARLWWDNVWGDGEAQATAAWRRISAGGGANSAQRAARRSARLAQLVADRLEPYREIDHKNPLASRIGFPDTDLGKSLANLSALIAQPLGVRLATVDAPGDFDTHDNQPEELTKSLGDVSAALSAFQADLEARGVADRVVTLVWSEFGRRPEANDSKGTDHGAGGLAWVQGTSVRSGVLSDYPDLKRLDDNGNLAVTLDFRRVYSSLIEQWLRTDATEVIPNSRAFGRVGLVR